MISIAIGETPLVTGSQTIYRPAKSFFAPSATRAIRHIAQADGNQRTNRQGRRTAVKTAKPASSSGCLLTERIVSTPWFMIASGLRQGAKACDSSLRWASALAISTARRSANLISFSFMIVG